MVLFTDSTRFRQASVIVFGAFLALGASPAYAKCSTKSFFHGGCDKAITQPVDSLSNSAKSLGYSSMQAANDAAAKAGFDSPDDMLSTLQQVGYSSTAALSNYATKDSLEMYNSVSQATGYANLAAADSAAVAYGFSSYAQRLIQDGQTVSSDEFQSFQSGLRNTYSKVDQDAATAYKTSASQVNIIASDGTNVLKSLFSACTSAATSSTPNLKRAMSPMIKAVGSLPADEQSALNRIIRMLGKGRVPDLQSAADLKQVGAAVGMLLPGNVKGLDGSVYQSNWGIAIAASGGYIVGANVSVGFAMDIAPTNGRYGFALIETTSAQIQAVPGASIEMDLGWGPGAASGSEGGIISVGAGDENYSASLSWTINDPTSKNFGKAVGQTLNNAIATACSIPGIAAGYGIEFGKVASESFGYSHVFWSTSF
jgi:hypothetical protein